MYNLLQSVSPTGLTQLAYPPALYSPAGNENPAVSLMQQLQQGHQAGILLGPAGIAGLTPQQQHQLAGAAGSNIYSSSSTAAYELSKPSFMQQSMFSATGPTALVGATGSTQLPTVTGAGLASTPVAAAGTETPSGSHALSLLPLPAAAANTQSHLLYNFPQHLQQVQLLERQPQHQQLLLGYGSGAQQPQQPQQQQQPWQPRRQQQQQQPHLQSQQPQSQQSQSVLIEQYQQQAFGSQSGGLQQQLPWLQSQAQQQNQVILQQQQQQQGQGQGQLLYEHAASRKPRLLQQADILSKASQQVLHKLGHWHQDQTRELQPEMKQPQPQHQQSQQPQQQHQTQTQSQQPQWQWVQQQTQQQQIQQQQIQQQQIQQQQIQQQQIQQQQQQQQQPRQSSQQQTQQQMPPQEMPPPQQRAMQQDPRHMAASAATQQAAANRQPNTQIPQQGTNEMPSDGARTAAAALTTAAPTASASISPAAGAAAATATAIAVTAAGATAGSSRGAATGAPLKSSSLPPPSTSAAGLTTFRAVIDWKATFAATVAPYEVLPPGHPAKGLAGLEELRLGAMEVLLVDAPEAANAAIEVLRSRMWDGIVAMDMEWRPDTVPGESHPVAVLQLSSAGLVVVVRTLTCGLPDAFRTGFMEDSDVELVVAAWMNNDERKFEESFGQPTFWCKITDIQKVAKACGHSKTGVRALVQAVLEPSVGMPKNKRVTMSDWSAPKLQPDQLKYAILDAACIEHVFRCLEGRF
ncbi:hypothetical protein VaNZ11_003554 [Volvox africanus]|uniref:3'-5' exonuclease domain-containing protein n=1 Tax=Volvox africanus TaxID=51714 RepID=A0ABQ5RVK5_9CHLO|nr:hypothetical protein VaNZ11_003554 [Volvox africanus]